MKPIPGAAHDCATCRGEGFVVRRGEGESALAKVCDCVAACAACQGGGWVASNPEDPRSKRRPCECQKASAKVARFDATRIPTRMFGHTLRSFRVDSGAPAIGLRKRMVEIVTGWQPDIHDNPGLVLYGDPGRGKTHLMVGLLRALVFERGISARFIELSHLITAIKAGFARDDGVNPIDELVAVDVLAIDELGKGRTEFDGSVLDEIVSRRYNAMKPIFATTNYQPTAATGRAVPNLALGVAGDVALVDRIGSRVYSRLRECCAFVECPGDDYRLRETSQVLSFERRTP